MVAGQWESMLRVWKREADEGAAFLGLGWAPALGTISYFLWPMQNTHVSPQHLAPREFPSISTSSFSSMDVPGRRPPLTLTGI